MAITFIGASGYYDSSASQSTNSMTIPAGTMPGDIVFALYFHRGGFATTVPTGWTLIAQNNDASVRYYQLFYKIVGAGEAPVTFSTTGASARMSVILFAYRGGFSIGDPIFKVSNTPYIVTDTTTRAASLDSSYNNSHLIFIGCGYNTLASSFTKPADIGGSVFREDIDIGNLNSDFWKTVCSTTMTAGSTGNIDATFTASVVTKHAFAVLLTPAGLTKTSRPGSLGSLL